MNKPAVTQKTPLYLAFLMLGACSAESAQPEADIETASSDSAWAPHDAPSIFDADLVYQIDELPREGQAASAPWAGNYWPVYEDSLNHRWDGEDSESPAEKYGRVFGHKGVPDAVSKSFGVDSMSSRTVCTDNEACDSKLGEQCSIREGQEEGRCIPTWFGICHAWAPAAVLYEEPRQAVTRNDVTLKVNDIKALLTVAHTGGLETTFVSGRCNEDEESDQIDYDQYGRPILGQCIDTNPATYHVLLTNYLGLRGESFVEDRTIDDEVWNQPVRAYRVTTLDEMTSQEANALVGVPPSGSETFEPAPEEKEFAQFGPFPIAAGETLRASLRGSGDADLFVRAGSAPESKDYDCKSGGASSNEVCELAAAEESREIYVGVFNYRDASKLQLVVSAGGAVPEPYMFNDEAERFFNVKLEVDYITESPFSLDGNLSESIDRYTRTDRYHYLLEADADGQLLGGEWLEGSKRDHVDFLWLPMHVSPHTVARGALDFHSIMGIYYSSVATENGEVVQEHNLNLRKGQWRRFGPFPVSEQGTFRVQIEGQEENPGDADLYVRRSGHPSSYWHDCRPYLNSSNEQCELPGNEVYYVGVYGYAARSAVSLKVTFQADLPGTPVDEDPIDEDPVDEDPVDEDPVDEDPVDEDPVDEDPVDEDPVDEDPVDEDPVAPVDEDTMDDDTEPVPPVEDDTMDDDTEPVPPVEDDTMDDDTEPVPPVEDDTMDDDTMDDDTGPEPVPPANDDTPAPQPIDENTDDENPMDEDPMEDDTGPGPMPPANDDTPAPLPIDENTEDASPIDVDPIDDDSGPEPMPPANDDTPTPQPIDENSEDESPMEDDVQPLPPVDGDTMDAEPVDEN